MRAISARNRAPESNRRSGLALGPVGIGYMCEWISGRAARPLYARIAFQGERADPVHTRGRQYARDVLPQLIDRRALDRIQSHRQQGDHVVVVSASLDVYWRPWCDSRGLDVICTELEERDGILTGRCVDGDCSGAEKPRRVRERYSFDQYCEIHAYGDSIDDRELLAIAHRPYYRWREVDRADAKTARAAGR